MQDIIKELESNNIVLIAVTKNKDASVIQDAYNKGLRKFGENYIQEAEFKIKKLSCLDIEWHFIGHLQSNKAKKAVLLFDVIQTVDSLNLAKSIDKEAGKVGKLQKIMIQINISGEENKHGIKKEELPGFLEELSQLKNINVIGLMEIGSFDTEKAISEFKDMKRLSDTHQDQFGLNFLSMGMSSDYKTAIEHGSNMVRLGRVLFGKRD